MSPLSFDVSKIPSTESWAWCAASLRGHELNLNLVELISKGYRPVKFKEVKHIDGFSILSALNEDEQNVTYGALMLMKRSKALEQENVDLKIKLEKSWEALKEIQ